MTTTERIDGVAPRAGQEAERLRTVVIGAGQTGLATAYFLGRSGVPCVVLDEHARVGDQWRRRYHSLLLNTPAQYDGLPGLPFPARRGSYPTGAGMGDHLERYVERMGITVRSGVTVCAVERRPDGSYRLTTTTGDILADDVVVACGVEQRPRVPDVSGKLDPGIRQLHSSDYRYPGQLLLGPVLVVGAGQSGADIALEAVRAGHETWLSGRAVPEVPVPFGSRRLRVGLPVLWFLANHVLTVRTPVGRRMQQALRQGAPAPLLRVRRADLAAGGVHLVEARTVGADDGRPVLADGTVLDVANVVWCTGFRQESGLVRPDVTGEDGYPRGEGVVDGCPGLYYVGLLFQTAFSSMLIGGAGRDAERVAAHIAARARRSA
jgi:putative flavoprotein involved in K+ transport